jgi:hypothetical protein
MTDNDAAMFWACVQTGIISLGVMVMWVIVSVVREWWRKK